MLRTRLFVISDLHIGGRYGTHGGERGFRLCTRVDKLSSFINSLGKPSPSENVELVINGDFVDFLAEPSINSSQTWRPFINDPNEALEIFNSIVERDRQLFDSLSKFINNGGQLTILLGNHDLELAFPNVRVRLEQVLNASGRIRFIFDGEAYSVGAVLIEHGNRYDPWNVVEHDAFRRHRSLLSRNEISDGFQAPAGSHLVAGVINQIKSDYPFIDLLKPETEAALPLLLALAPGYRSHIFAAAKLALSAYSRPLRFTVQRKTLGDISANEETDYATDTSSFVLGELRKTLSQESLNRFLNEVPLNHQDTDGDISSTSVQSVWSWMRLITASAEGQLSDRMGALHAALEATRESFDFCRSREKDPYYSAVKSLWDLGWEVVVFGHTHLAKHISGKKGQVYINTGTWADVIKFPLSTLDSTNDKNQLQNFIDDIVTHNFAPHIITCPTYAEIVLGGTGNVESACLRDYDS